jgi:hypothetical protein
VVLFFLWTCNFPGIKERLQWRRDLFFEIAGAGCAGAIALSGFGKIANRGEYKTKVVNGQSFTYYEFISLTDNDFDNLAPGSFVQLWRFAREYQNNIIDYLYGFSNVIPNLIWGHSAIYMGKKNGQHTFSDATGGISSTNELEFEIRIAAQLYDAEGIPPEAKWDLTIP